MTSYILAAGHACTPGSCTLGEVAHDYTSAGFVVGLIVLAVAVFAGKMLVRAARRGRR